MVVAVLSVPRQEHVLAPEPGYMMPQDRHDKQDCEQQAIKRWGHSTEGSQLRLDEPSGIQEQRSQFDGSSASCTRLTASTIRRSDLRVWNDKVYHNKLVGYQRDGL